MPEETCREKILSEDYVDIIIPDYRGELELVLPESQACVQNLGFGYRAVHVEKNLIGAVSFDKVG